MIRQLSSHILNYRTLAEASSSGEGVVILSHIPFCPDACDPVCLLWNYQQVVECHTFNKVLLCPGVGRT